MASTVRVSSTIKIEDALRSFVEEGTPHNRTVGLRLVSAAVGGVTCSIPYSQALAGDAASGVIDEGVVATLIDVTCGSSVCMRLGRLQSIATLELRIDFVRAPTPGRPLTARGHCYEMVRSAAFVRASVHDGDEGDLVACAQGTFVLTGG